MTMLSKLAKKTLAIDEKIKFLNFAPRNQKLGWRKLVDLYKIGKTAAANILKDKKSNMNNIKCFVKNQKIVTAMAGTTR